MSRQSTYCKYAVYATKHNYLQNILFGESRSEILSTQKTFTVRKI